MSETPSGLTAGIFGKLPSRGDFVRSGLPADFVAAWDEWAQRMLVYTRAVLEDRWEAAWLDAPAWRFAMPPGSCGAGAAIGVMLPSVDRVGRYFPLAVAAVSTSSLAELSSRADDFLDRVEQAGREAVGGEVSPENLSERVGAALAEASQPADTAVLEAGWWTEGTPDFAPVFCGVVGLPDVKFCVRLLEDAEPGS